MLGTAHAFGSLETRYDVLIGTMDDLNNFIATGTSNLSCGRLHNLASLGCRDLVVSMDDDAGDTQGLWQLLAAGVEHSDVPDQFVLDGLGTNA